MIGRTLWGWFSNNAKSFVHKGNASSLASFGSVPVVLMFGDDLQLSPVQDKAIYNHAPGTPAQNEGLLAAYASITHAVVLTEQVRQTDSKFRGILNRLRKYETTGEDADEMYKWRIESQSEATKEWLDKKAIWLFPRHVLE